MQKEGKGDRLSASLGIRPSNGQAPASSRTSSLTSAAMSGSTSKGGPVADRPAFMQGELRVNAERPPSRRQEPPPPPPAVVSSVATPQLPADPSRLRLANADWNFVEEPKDMFLCEICASVLSEPHLLLCCSNEHMCLKCVEQWRAKGVGGVMEAACPFCNTTNFQTRLNVDLKNHILDLEVRCLYHKDGCRWTGKLGEAELHVTNDCKFFPVSCRNGCGTPGIQRQHLEHHMTQCGYAIVQCPFRSIGCLEMIQRRHIPVHMQQGIHYHLKEVSVKTAAVSASSSAHLKKLRAKYESQHKAKEREIASLREKIAQVQVTVDSLEKKLRDSRPEIDTLREEQERSTAHCLAELREKGEQIVRLRDTHLALNAQIQAIPAAKVATGFVVPPVLFTIDNFSERQKCNEVWCSPPFYTHYAGYKMCLRVYTNGSGESKGVNMSVYVHFMEGEYDDHLQWPFEGLVTLVLLNQQQFIRKLVIHSTSTNYRCKIFMDTEGALSRNRADVNEGYGYGKGRNNFMPLKDLGKYLTLGGKLEIKVLKITFLPL